MFPLTSAHTAKIASRRAIPIANSTVASPSDTTSSSRYDLNIGLSATADDQRGQKLAEQSDTIRNKI